jgi:hypothetical protein
MDNNLNLFVIEAKVLLFMYTETIAYNKTKDKKSEPKTYLDEKDIIVPENVHKGILLERLEFYNLIEIPHRYWELDKKCYRLTPKALSLIEQVTLGNLTVLDNEFVFDLLGNAIFTACLMGSSNSVKLY